MEIVVHGQANVHRYLRYNWLNRSTSGFRIVTVSMILIVAIWKIRTKKDEPRRKMNKRVEIRWTRSSARSVAGGNETKKFRSVSFCAVRLTASPKPQVSLVAKREHYFRTVTTLLSNWIGRTCSRRLCIPVATVDSSDESSTVSILCCFSSNVTTMLWALRRTKPNEYDYLSALHDDKLRIECSIRANAERELSELWKNHLLCLFFSVCDGKLMASMICIVLTLKNSISFGTRTLMIWREILHNKRCRCHQREQCLCCRSHTFDRGRRYQGRLCSSQQSLSAESVSAFFRKQLHDMTSPRRQHIFMRKSPFWCKTSHNHGILRQRCMKKFPGDLPVKTSIQ